MKNSKQLNVKAQKAIVFCSLLFSNGYFAQFGLAPLQNTSTQTTGGNVGIGTGAPQSKLEILSTSNQLRLSYSSSLFSNLYTNVNGNLVLTPSATGKKIGFGIDPNPSDVHTGFHSNLGAFKITNPVSLNTRGLSLQPNQTPGGEMPFGSSIAANITTSGEGFSLSAGTATGVKLGAYAFTGFGGWRSVWETANVSFGSPNLLLVKSGGNVGIGTGPSGIVGRFHVYSAGLDYSYNTLLQVNKDLIKALAINNTNPIYNGLDNFVVYGSGKTQIGNKRITTGPHTDCILSVDGKVVAKSLYITMTDWADFVFANDYKLTSLKDVETYYKTNKHLPEIPSEKEVIENGVNVADMNKLLLKKVEELTLYLVQQQKEIDALKK
ncbi:MAG: hypothetical protein ACK50L_13125 [Bacteroidota bacterium]